MEFNEFQKAIQGESGEENKRLRKELEDLKKENKELKEVISALNDDCKALCNRCHMNAMINGGAGSALMMCMHCSLKQYECERFPNIEEQELIGKAIKKHMKKDK